MTKSQSFKCILFLSLANFFACGFVGSPNRPSLNLRSDIKVARNVLRMNEDKPIEAKVGESEGQAASADKSEEPEKEQAVVPEEEMKMPSFGEEGFFMPNANLRYGSSKDQDGKSNVWAIEPKMKVEEMDTEGESSPLTIGLTILAASGVAVAAILANLPPPDTY
mmetsp:Transcript_3139/g.4838  ORF Transcript_3139/g.4838 Transcript_3139/m.4838 type:complete len:165 (-) Transcript_3139:103-597(-)|eukprot:CAMPEP_0171457108 /NCGR_PEP_ID=MMETSP0945-20130129/3319_1 /TAXON_ID=109269 /ORGANISM="Vaucheria litorea, Strain CCMP2940" /LENGTH=164 /DNA_ID=CAMNT_0011982651 /DNA_START=66 /DNA_END=560 /DNA_ORIENTATION=-